MKQSKVKSTEFPAGLEFSVITSWSQYVSTGFELIENDGRWIVARRLITKTSALSKGTKNIPIGYITTKKEW